jgi:Mrp family chromosome partitioning ATPase
MTVATTQKAARPVVAPPRPVVRPAAKPEPDANVGAGRMLAWLKLYWLTILFCGGLLGAVLAYLAWAALPSKYESYALLRVASSPFTVSNNRDPNRSRTDFTTYLKTNSQLIKNEFVLNKALGLEIDGVLVSDLATIREQKNPFQFLEDELAVNFQDGSEIIKLSMKGHNPDDVRRIVNAVQKAFMQEVIEKEIKERQDFLLVLETTLVGLQKTLNEKTPKAVDPLLVPAVGNENKAPNPLPPGVIPAVGIVANGPPDWVKKQIAAARVSKSLALQEQVTDLPIVIASQKARIDMLKKQIEGGATGLTPEVIAAAVDRDPEVKAMDAEEQRLRREVLLDRSRYVNPNAPAIAAKEERADQYAKELAALKVEKAKLFAKATSGTPGLPANPKVAEYEAAVLRLQDLETQFASAKARLSAAMEEVAKLPPDADPLKPVEHRKDDDRKALDPETSRAEAEDGIFRGLAQNAAALRLDLSSPKRVSVLQTASSPMQRDTRKQVLATAFAGLLGFALVGLVAFGYEVVVKKACGLADVKATAAMPVVGVVPWQNAASMADPVRRAEVSESIDKLRTYVTHTLLPRGAMTVTLTSPLGDEGKAFAAFALANSLADAGYKTLAVDFDLRTPQLHGLAKLDAASPGVCELLRGESDFRHTIKTLPNGLHMIPAGKWTDVTRCFSGSGRLEQLLACLKEPFDCVILHGHPLLTAAESIEVARRSDVVLLCTLCRETTLPLLKKAADRLSGMELPFSGVVYLGATPQEALC